MAFARYLAIGGFKAFKDWSLLDLSPGVSVLVGRNGSGKSTIVEALLWVLGEKDMATLRAAETADLHFRPPSDGLGTLRTEREQHLLFVYPEDGCAEAEEAGADPGGDQAAGGGGPSLMTAAREADVAEAPGGAAGIAGASSEMIPGGHDEGGGSDAEEPVVAYLVLGDEADVLEHDEDGSGCCCRAVKDQRREVPEGLVTVARKLDRSGRDWHELDGEEASPEQVHQALSRHGLHREVVSVIRQGELERILLADPELRVSILAEAAGLTLSTEDDEETLVLELERERLRERIAELETEPAAENASVWMMSEGCSDAALDPGGDPPIPSTTALLAAALASWGTEGGLPGGKSRLLALLGLSEDDGSDWRGDGEALLRELQRAAERGRGRLLTPGGERPVAGLTLNGAAYLATVLEEQRRLRDALAGVEAEVEKARSAAADRRAQQRLMLRSSHAKVERRFARFFDRLVAGGRAELPLQLADRLSESTMDVRVAFPGSGFERIDALSGGQRAMAAFALGLALFLETPSRLVVLDEVEPALDDSNLRRFNDLLHEVAETRQVVVVSHQRRTKDVGDVVFGVDVTGDGASMLHFRFEPATKRLILFGRTRGNWLERNAALEDSEAGWSGPRSASLPAGPPGKTCC
jgi:ABC-type Mn2+/Zn2+ transport system ATPase subunit